MKVFTGNRIKLLLLAILFLAPGISISQEKTKRLGNPGSDTSGGITDEFFDKGLLALDNGQILEAIDYFDKSLELRPDNSEAWYFKAFAQEQLYDYNSAIISFETALQISPGFSEALFDLAILYYKIGNYQDARERFERLAGMPPGETQAVFFRGLKHGDQGSGTQFDELITMSDKDADIYNYIGLCYMKTGEPEKSIEYFNRSISIRTNDDNFFVNRGLAYSQLSQGESAAKDYRTALSINPDNTIAGLNLSMLDDSDPRVPAYINGLSDSDHAAVFAYRAYTKFNKGDLQGAIEDYDSAIVLDETDPGLFLNRGIVYEKSGDFDLAMKDFTVAGVLDPGNAKIYSCQGNVHFKQNHFSNSIQSYSKAIELDPTDGSSYYNRAISYYNLDKPDSACFDAIRAVELGLKQAEQFVEKKCTGQN